MHRSWFSITLVAALVAGRAHAQTAAPDVSRELKLLESTERGLDPLGIDESTGKQLDEAARRLEEARRRAAAPKPRLPIAGEVLSSIEGVQEVAHDVRVRFAQGLAFVDIAQRFEARGAESAEVAYRLPLPEGGAVYAVEACRGVRCAAASARAPKTERPSAPPGEPWLEATPIQDARGRALAIRAGAAQRGTPLSVRVQYVAAAEVHAGFARFRLPARGYDPRIAPSHVVLEAPQLEELTPAAELTLDANLPVDVAGKVPHKAKLLSELTRATCAGRPCSRAFEAAPSAAATARETWLLLDASPSMEGRARNAADRALTDLLALLPEQTPLRVLAFAASAREVGRFEAASAPLATLSDALAQDLGGASRPGSVLELAGTDLSRARPRVLLLSDGKFDAAATHELSALRRHGAELWWIALSAEPSPLAAHVDGVIPFAGAADLEHSEERLSGALAPRVKPGLVAGEQRVRESGPKQPYVPLSQDGWLSFWLARAAAPSWHSLNDASAGSIRAPAFAALPPKPAAVDTGMPKESVLSMLRNQLVPQARGCLRSDRKGRGDYAVALTFHALFADREAYDVRIEGKIPDALRKCLGDVVPRLRVPAFSGRIRVRYPIHTEREPESPVIELEGDARALVDGVIESK